MGARSRGVVAGAAVALYTAALFLPTAAPFDTVYTGWDAFRGGWRAVLAFKPEFAEFWVLAGAWVANPLVWAAVAATVAGRRRVCRVAAVCGLLLSLPALGWYGGMISRHPGYWAWVASAALLLAGSWPRWTPRLSRPHEPLELSPPGVMGLLLRAKAR